MTNDLLDAMDVLLAWAEGASTVLFKDEPKPITRAREELAKARGYAPKTTAEFILDDMNRQTMDAIIKEQRADKKPGDL